MSWEMVKLDDCLQLITYGFTNPMPDSEEGPWKVTAKDIVDGRIDFTTARHTTVAAFENDLTDKSRPIRDDLLLTKDGTLGRLAIVGDETICINQSVALLRLKKELLLPRYLLYLLQSPEYQGKMLADAGGSTIKHIYITKVNQLMIPVPPLEVQRNLIDILSAYDRMIDNCKEQIKLLEEAAQRLYKEWFVDLRFPGHETTPITDGIPEGWHTAKLSDVADVNGESISKQYPYEHVDYVDLGSVSKGHIEAVTRFSVQKAPGRAKRIASDGDVIWGMVRPNLKSYALVFHPSETSVYSTGFAVLSAKKVPFSFLYCHVTQEDFVGYLVNCTNGAAYPAVKPVHFEEANITIPSDALLRQFHLIAEPMCRKIEVLENQIKQAKEARDRLLPKLTNGEIEV